MNVLIIGGGAAGMIAALTAKANGHQVTVVERQARVGRKLLATGNGRCNLTNENMDLKYYHGQDVSFMEPAMCEFGLYQTLECFLGLGLITITEENGRVYPRSDQAGSVVDTLRFALDRAGVDLRLGIEITGLKKNGGNFLATGDGVEILADRVIVCCGGMAGGKLGGGNGGYALLNQLGHHSTKLFPALVQLKTDTTYVRSLKGVRADAGVYVMNGKTVVAETAGEVQFTESGISGPAVFEISRCVSTCDEPLTVRLDLLREYNMYQTEQLVAKHIDTFHDQALENLLTGTIHNRLGRTLIRYAGFDLNTPVAALKARDGKKIANALKSFKLTVVGTNGFDSAQVTAGGMKTSEFNPDTLESKLVPGLYAAGEVLDIDGDCGGYNLQWAWSSGQLAGMLR